MKKQIKFLMLTAILSFSVYAYSQKGRVGINTTDPKTTLDVSGKTDTLGNLLTTDVTGLQAPRLTRAELTDKGNSLYGSDQKGALVYITDVSTGDNASQRVNITTIGYYYFDGSVWQKIGSGGVTSNTWTLLGNEGTTAGTNFIGTKDKQDLVAKVNNTEIFRATWDEANTAARLAVGQTTAVTVASAASGSTAAQRLAKLTISGGDASINGVTVGFGGGQISSNTIVGNGALYNNATGINNVAIGNASLNLNAVGTGNTSVGYQSLTSNTGGNANTATGFRSLANNTTGGNNTANGLMSLQSNTTGDFNTASGYNSLYYNSSGIGNTAFGTQTLVLNTTGSFNTASGYRALNNLSSAGSNNNIALGYYAGTSQTAGSNNIIIGANINAPNLTGSNQMNIGNIIYGTGINTATPEAGNIGIGTIAPISKLEVNGAATNKVAYDAAAATIIDYSKSNLAYTTANAGAFTLTNMKDGGTYTLSVRGATSGTSVFTAAGFSVRYINNRASVANTHTIYTFVVMGSVIYVYMATAI